MKSILFAVAILNFFFLVEASMNVAPSRPLVTPQKKSLPSLGRLSRRTKKNIIDKTPILEDTTDEMVLEQAKKRHITSYVAECNMPTENGVFKMRSYIYNSPNQKLEPVVMVYGDVSGKDDLLVRVHDQCLTSEVFGSLRCDCREQLKESLKLIQKEGCGIVIYLQQEGRGIGIANKVAAYSLQDDGFDTVEANHHLGFKDELREYLAVPDILKDLNVSSIRLVTNNPYKIQQLTSLGVKINKRISIQMPSNPFNERYLKIKKEKMNHLFTDDLFTQSKIETIETSNSQSSNPISKDAKELSHQDSIVDFSQPIQYALGKETVIAAIEAVKKGDLVIVVDDADRENEGDLIMAAEKATDETIGFMVRYTSGVICVSLEDDRLQELGLPPMVINNEDPKQTAYAVSVDAKENTTTGISAADRATTFRKLVDLSAQKNSFTRPGHVFPLRYKPGGVLVRAGHTEASLDLTKLAGLRPGGVLAEIVHDDGSMMRLPDLKIMAKRFGLVLTSVQDIKAYRLENKIDFSL